MGALDQPGQQQGLKPTPIASPRPSTPFHKWFPQFLRDELKPYPGRTNLVLRYTIAATLTMLLITTFRIPGAASGGFFALLVSRDSPKASLRGGITSIVAYFAGLAFVLCGAMLFVDYPLTHFLWVILSFFVAFFSISALSNYGAATAFAIAIVLSLPVWDQGGPQSLLVVANLWTASSVALAIVVAVIVEYIFALFNTKDELIDGMTERLDAVHSLLVHAAQSADRRVARERVRMLATVGVSRLRRLALSDSSRDTSRLTTTASLVGRVVDILAPFRGFHNFEPEQKKRVQILADHVAALRYKLRHPSSRTVTPLTPAPDGPLLLVSLEQTLELLRLSISTHAGIDPSGNVAVIDPSLPAEPPLFKLDAFTNPEHLHFALRGCMASVVCYFILNATFWPGLSTSLFTCVVTALSSIGTSRQKQLLRTSGAICGGLILGLGSQVLILPMLDTIVGFTVMFAAVTVVAAWFLTSSPRLSYFGTQMALAFYLIQLRGPFPQTNIAIARDNVMGILLGLMAMYLVFETLGSKPAVQVMRELFAENLSLMAQVAKPWTDSKSIDFKKIRTMRDRISQNFAAVNSQADAVLFELGRDRTRSLAVRERLLEWQPELRSLFLMQVALLQYRLQVLPTELPPGILPPAYRFDTELSNVLKAIAQSFSGKHVAYDTAPAYKAYDQLKDVIERSYSETPTRARAVLALSAQILDLTCRLLKQIRSSPV
jgi:multidrug resistance protein MdtO